MIEYSGSTLQLPWTLSDENKRFNVILYVAFAIFIVVAIPLSFIKVPEQSREEREQMPPQLARIMLEKIELPKTPTIEKPIEAPKVVAQLEPKKIQEPVEEAKPLSESKAKVEALEKRKQLTNSDLKAQEKAKKSGLLALANELDDLRDMQPVKANLANRLTSESSDKMVAAVRDSGIINSGVASSGGAVNTGQYAKDISSTQIADRNSGKVESKLFADGKKNSNGEKGGAAKVRTEEEVALMFEKNKNSLNMFYERERRKTPGLQGKIVMLITIAPSGEVTQVKIISSELNNPDLEARLIGRIKLFKFSQVGTETVSITYPIEFLSS